MVNPRYNSEKFAFNRPMYVQAELTKYCPATCPQCYMDKDDYHMPWEIFESLIAQMKAMDVGAVLLTGGEPLCYPYIENAVYTAAKNGITPIISTSGIGFNTKLAYEFKKSGLFKICISLNGSTEEIHNRSRSHFDEGLQALEVAVKAGLDVVINWVARSDNYKDFPEMHRLAKNFGVSSIDIISNKRNCANVLCQPLAEEEEKILKEYVIKLQNEEPEITTELCYFSLHKSLNPNRSKLYLSCMAGRAFVDFLADGSFCPCRHMEILEKTKGMSLKSYWNENEALNTIRRQNALCEQCYGVK